MNPTKMYALALGALAVAGSAGAQQTPAPAPVPLAVGAAAPDFALPGATKEGLTAAPVHLSDFRDQLVVLAFFFKARTKG
ncbi:MAG: hypothetical protein ACHQXA_07410 [Gemmatimonadales bacterium]